MTEEFKLISKSKLEEIYRDQAELVDALRDLIDLCQEPSEWVDEERAIYDNALHVLGKVTQTKGE